MLSSFIYKIPTACMMFTTQFYLCLMSPSALLWKYICLSEMLAKRSLFVNGIISEMNIYSRKWYENNNSAIKSKSSLL